MTVVEKEEQAAMQRKGKVEGGIFSFRRKEIQRARTTGFYVLYGLETERGVYTYAACCSAQHGRASAILPASYSSIEHDYTQEMHDLQTGMTGGLTSQPT